MLLLLLRSQQPGDIIVIKRYLNMMRDGETVLSQLFDFMVERSSVPPIELERITADEFGPDYNKRIYELREKVIHAMNTDWYTQRPGRFSERSQVRATLKQKLDAADVIWQMSDSMATWLFHRVIAQAEKYELYGELSRALTNARQSLSLRLSQAEYSRLSEELLSARKAEDGVTLALRLRQDGAHQHRKSSPDKNVSWHINAHRELEELEHSTNSKSIRFHRLLFLSDLYCRQHFWNDASNALSEAWHLLENQVSVRQPHLKILVLHHQGDVMLSAGQFDAALTITRSALQLNKAENFNWLNLKKMEADALFYTGQFASAFTTYQLVQHHPNGNFDETFKDVLRYSMANCQTALGNYQSAIDLLNDITILPRLNKTGFNLSVRGLHALCLIALDDHAQLYDEMQKQRVYYSRLKNKSQIGFRYEALYRILLGYSLIDGINHKRVVNERAVHFENLRSGSNDCRWQPNGFEMIVYDQFLDALVAGQPYDFMLPDYLYQVS